MVGAGLKERAMSVWIEKIEMLGSTIVESMEEVTIEEIIIDGDES
jgi:hypothetical protein